MILPISATILAQQRAYDGCLERLSVPLIERLVYGLDSFGMIDVEGMLQGLLSAAREREQAQALARTAGG